MYSQTSSSPKEHLPALLAVAVILLITMTQIGWQAWQASQPTENVAPGPTQWRIEYYSATSGANPNDHLPPPDHNVYNLLTKKNDGLYGVAERDSAVEAGLAIEGFNVKSEGTKTADIEDAGRLFRASLQLFEVEGDVITEIDWEA